MDGGGSLGSLEAEVTALVGDERIEDALELLESLDGGLGDDAAGLALHELVRARLFGEVRRGVGMDAVPRLRVSAEELLRFNLPAEAGFLLSLIDGRTPLADVLSLSGTDPLASLRGLRRLVAARLVELA